MKPRLSIPTGGKEWPVLLLVPAFLFLMISSQESGEGEFLSKDTGFEEEVVKVNGS